MNQKQITDEVKRLAREIAEYWRMDLHVGDWILFGALGGVLRLIDYEFKKHLDETGYGDDFVIPIPSISDCLEKLRELGFTMLCECYDHENYWWSVELFVTEGGEDAVVDEKRGDTLHESLLSAVLAVLEEGK